LAVEHSLQNPNATFQHWDMSYQMTWCILAHMPYFRRPGHNSFHLLVWFNHVTSLWYLNYIISCLLMCYQLLLPYNVLCDEDRWACYHICKYDFYNRIFFINKVTIQFPLLLINAEGRFFQQPINKQNTLLIKFTALIIRVICLFLVGPLQFIDY